MSNILIIWTVQALNGIPLLVHPYAPDFTIISKVQEKIFPIKKNMTNPETFAMFSFTYTQNWTNLDLDNRSVLRQTPAGLTQMALQRKTIVRNTTIIVTTFNQSQSRTGFNAVVSRRRRTRRKKWQQRRSRSRASQWSGQREGRRHARPDEPAVVAARGDVDQTERILSLSRPWQHARCGWAHV